MPPKGLGETLALSANALQTLMNVVTGASKKEQIQGAIDQYHATIASRVGGFGQGQEPFTLATPPGHPGAVDFGPYVQAAQGRVNEMLKRLEGGGQSDTSSAAASAAEALDLKVRGRKRTILTGARGDLSTAPTSAPTLLGDVGYGKNKPGS